MLCVSNMAPIEENTPKAGEEVEDTPLVVELKKLDDEYLKLQREYDSQAKALARKYTEKQQPLLSQREKVLVGEVTGEDSKTGTPALKGFWCKALQNHPALEDQIEEYDEPVLEYLRDVIKVDLDPDDQDKGFRLKFHFAENPYFTNAVLSKEYHTKEGSPYTGEIDVTEIRGCTVEWKDGKDVTVEMVKKKVKGGGAKKAKQAKEKEEPRSSFFRSFFRTLKEGGRLPDDVDPEELSMMCGEEDVDEEQLVELLMENDHEVGSAIRDNIIPFAVRWYTGEAAPDNDDDDDEDSEEEDGDDEDDSEDSDEDEPTPKGKKAPAKKKAESKPAATGDKKEEECKQQ